MVRPVIVDTGVLVALLLPGSRIWTTDSDFLVYRLSGKKSPAVILPD